MVWLRVDDRELDRQAWEHIEDAHGSRIYADCVATWLALSLRCARRIGEQPDALDGVIASTDTRRIPETATGTARCVEVLEAAGILERTADALMIARFDEQQPRSSSVVRQREKWADWKKNQRDDAALKKNQRDGAVTKSHAKSEMSTAESTEESTVVSAEESSILERAGDAHARFADQHPSSVVRDGAAQKKHRRDVAVTKSHTKSEMSTVDSAEESTGVSRGSRPVPSRSSSSLRSEEGGASEARPPVLLERIEELSKRYPSDLLAEVHAACRANRKTGRMAPGAWCAALERLAVFEPEVATRAMQVFADKYGDGSKNETYLVGIARGERDRRPTQQRLGSGVTRLPPPARSDELPDGMDTFFIGSAAE